MPVIDCSENFLTMNLKPNIISVVLPVYNSGRFLTECLESLDRQSFRDLQIIAIDDFSKDDSFSILKKFSRKIKGLKIYKNKKHYGLGVCYNRGMKQAKGQFVIFMSPLDMIKAAAFKKQLSFLHKNPKTVAIGTQYAKINEKGKIIMRSTLPQESGFIYNQLLTAKSIHPESVIINRHLLPKDLLYFKSNKYPLLFNEVFIKLFQYGLFANLNECLYFKRTGLRRPGRKLSSSTNIVVSAIKLWLTSRSNHDYRPSFRTFIYPFLKPTLN